MSEQESAEGTIVLTPDDPPIIDEFSNRWGMTAAGQLLFNGILDRSAAGVTKLGYSERSLWFSDRTGQWRSRHHRTDPWSKPSWYSPFITDKLDAILAAVASLQTDVDQKLAQIILALSPAMPTKLALDVAGATIESQPTPTNPGP